MEKKAYKDMTEREKAAFRREIARECRYTVLGYSKDIGGWDSFGGYRTVREAKKAALELLSMSDERLFLCEKAAIIDEKESRIRDLYNTDGEGFTPDILARSTPRIFWGVGVIAEAEERERLAFMREIYALETASHAAV